MDHVLAHLEDVLTQMDDLITEDGMTANNAVAGMFRLQKTVATALAVELDGALMDGNNVMHSRFSAAIRLNNIIGTMPKTASYANARRIALLYGVMADILAGG